jgi:hypothetical protein
MLNSNYDFIKILKLFQISKGYFLNNYNLEIFEPM